MNTGRGRCTNHSSKTCNFLLKKPRSESSRVKRCYVSSVRTCPEKAVNALQIISNSEKTSSEPPERMFIPPEKEPPERMQVPPERDFVRRSLILDTTEFMQSIPRQPSSKEVLSVDIFFNVSQIIQQLNAANRPCGGFQVVDAPDKRCRMLPHIPP